jgi:hypothetical protein
VRQPLRLSGAHAAEEILRALGEGPREPATRLEALTVVQRRTT